MSGVDLEVVGGSKEGRTSGAIIAITAALIKKLIAVDFPAALFLTPTKEAAYAAFEFAQALCAGTGPKVQSLIGGRNDPRASDNSDKYDLLVATPGKVLGAVEKCLLNPKAISYLILDDAHDLLGQTGICGHTQNVWSIVKSDALVRVVISNIKLACAMEYMSSQHLKEHIIGCNGRFNLQMVDTRGTGTRYSHL